MSFNFNLIQLGAYVYYVRKYLDCRDYEAVLRVLAVTDSLLDSLDSTLPSLSEDVDNPMIASLIGLPSGGV